MVPYIRARCFFSAVGTPWQSVRRSQNRGTKGFIGSRASIAKRVKGAKDAVNLIADISRGAKKARRRARFA